MLVRFIKPTSTIHGTIQACAVRDVPESDAVVLFNAGVAVPVKEDIQTATAPPPKETATSVPTKSKVGRPRKRK